MPTYEDCTPTWEAMTPFMINTIQNGEDPKNVEDIKGELLRMARLADKYNEAAKAGRITTEEE